MSTIDFTDFSKVELRAGTITEAEEFPRARKPAYKLWVDFGAEIGTLQTSAQITDHYTPDALIGKQILGCINLGEKNIAGFTSQFLCTGLFDSSGQVVLLSPDHPVPNGAKLA